MVIALSIERALLPSWFDVVRRVSRGLVRRMAVIHAPDEWYVRCELPEQLVEVWQARLQEAWRAHAAGVH